MERVNDINKISKALNESRAKLNHYLSTLGWKQDLLGGESCVKCPVNKEHSLPASSFDQHVYKCKLSSEGIDPKDVCPSSHFFYKNSLAVVPVIIDKKKYESFKDINKEAVKQEETVSSISKTGKSPVDTLEASGQDPCDIPLTMSASNSELNSSQRGVMYDYVIQTAKAIKRRAEDELDDLDHLAENTDQKDNKNEPKSHLEELAELRDYKRRRQSYRAKNVHMTKRSNVEVMRDLIETQMKLLQEQSKDSFDN